VGYAFLPWFTSVVVEIVEQFNIPPAKPKNHTLMEVQITIQVLARRRAETRASTGAARTGFGVTRGSV